MRLMKRGENRLMKRSVKRVVLGRVLAVAGFLWTAAGALGLIWSGPAEPEASPSIAAESPMPASAPSSLPPTEAPVRPDPPRPEEETLPTPEEETPPKPEVETRQPPTVPNMFAGSYAGPEAFTYRLDDPGVPAPDAPGFHRVARIQVHRTENPASGASAEALLVELAEVPDREFSVIAVVEAESPPAPGSPEAIEGLHWVMTYSNGQFEKTASRIASGKRSSEPSDSFNTRYQGFGDRAEVEFYGPPGTRYFAVLLADGEFATLVVP